MWPKLLLRVFLLQSFNSQSSTVYEATHTFALYCASPASKLVLLDGIQLKLKLEWNNFRCNIS